MHAAVLAPNHSALNNPSVIRKQTRRGELIGAGLGSASSALFIKAQTFVCNQIRPIREHKSARPLLSDETAKLIVAALIYFTAPS